MTSLLSVGCPSQTVFFHNAPTLFNFDSCDSTAYHQPSLGAKSIPLSRNSPLKLVHPDLLDPYSFTFDPGLDNLFGITGKTRSTDRLISWYSNHDISSQSATNHGTRTTISPLILPPIMVLEPRYLLSACYLEPLEYSLHRVWFLCFQ